MATTTIEGLTAVTAGNLTGAAVIEVEDSNGDTRKSTLATLRTKMFAGGTGYTAADPLVCGTLNASGTSTLAAVTATTFAGTDTFTLTKSAHTQYIATISNPDTTTSDYNTQAGWSVSVAGNNIGALKSTAKTLAGLSRVALYLTTSGVYDLAFGVNSSAAPSGWFDGSTGLFTLVSGLQLANGAPSALADGQVWYDGTNLKCRLGGATKTITVS